MRKWMLTLCFLLVFLLFCMVRIVRINEWHRYYMAVGTGVMLLLALWSLEKKLKRFAWNKPMAVVWISLCLAMTVSGVLVPKKYFGVGEVLLVLFTMVFFLWRNYFDPVALRGTFLSSVRLSFLLSSLYGFLFRPHTEGMRYAGFLINPNMFGMYLVIVLCVYLAYLDGQIEERKKLRYCWANYFELAMSCFFLFMTQSRTVLLAVAFLFGTWFFIRLHIGAREEGRKGFLLRTALAVVLAVAMFPLFYQGIRTIPHWVDRPVVYQNDALFADQSGFGRVVYAAKEPAPDEGEDHSMLSRMWRAFTDPYNNDISTGRFAIYRSYLEALNWTGHRAIGKRVDGQLVAHAHNNFLQIAYTYGLAAGILYVLLEVFAIYYALRYYFDYRKKGMLAFFPFAVVCSFFVMTMTECAFLPFHAFPAFAFWFVMGWLVFKWE